MFDREDGVKIRQPKRDRDKIDWLRGEIRRIQSSGHVLANVGIPGSDPGVLANVRIRFVQGTAASYVSIPPNQNGAMAKGR